MLFASATLVSALLANTAVAQKCQGAAPSKAIVAKGFIAKVFASGLSQPRGLTFDSEGNLLVVERGRGITAFKITEDAGGCLPTAGAKSTAIGNAQLNHGIDLSPDGKTLFASSVSTAWSWPYDAKQAKTTGPATTLVTGMSGSDHTTRTILISKKAPGTMLISRGSGSNYDIRAKTIGSGFSQIRSFDIAKVSAKSVAYTEGKVIGWGLRNSVGLGENPADGGIWSNENGADQMDYGSSKLDIHETNPGEEINYHGKLTENSPQHGKNYGYPECAATWDTRGMPQTSLKVGQHFAPNPPRGTSGAVTATDAACQGPNYVAPRLSLPSHWAPIDMAFTKSGSVAYMTSRGSWNKNTPDGYQLFAIDFKDGQPTHPATSKSAAIAILENRNVGSACKGFVSGCFRPTGVAIDAKGRIYMASDGTGEIYVIGKSDGSSVHDLAQVEPYVRG
ncbi:soluble quino protein glucose dehydrogenase [Microthyrium microscopicum]|uniref:Soluble quino protein glucose dehydrogenase n=1 Tax=Microthyrium microscopicum TaxID=703497 RepID=A0A6A6U3M3_9PEZI|nr:soluble quino protein glucose dehydrogenase [Microthyrium microscopicum]